MLTETKVMNHAVVVVAAVVLRGGGGPLCPGPCHEFAGGQPGSLALTQRSLVKMSLTTSHTLPVTVGGKANACGANQQSLFNRVQQGFLTVGKGVGEGANSPTVTTGSVCTSMTCSPSAVQKEGNLLQTRLWDQVQTNSIEETMDSVHMTQIDLLRGQPTVSCTHNHGSDVKSNLNDSIVSDVLTALFSREWGR